jgi:hypothetical protein
MLIAVFLDSPPVPLTDAKYVVGRIVDVCRSVGVPPEAEPDLRTHFFYHARALLTSPLPSTTSDRATFIKSVQASSQLFIRAGSNLGSSLPISS